MLRTTLAISLIISFPSVASDLANMDSAVTVITTPAASGFDIQGSFVVPLSTCQSYHLLTDYEMERELPGVISIEHHRIATRRVRLQRELEERVLFLSVGIQSVIEITELPYRGMDFVQISGNTQSYKGQWRLLPIDQGTRFVYSAHTNPGSIFPDSLARQIVESSLKKSFDAMKQIAQKRQSTLNNQCL